MVWADDDLKKEQKNLTKLKIKYKYERPNALIYKFQGFFLKKKFLIKIGSITFEDGSREALSNNNFILRGCNLKNTEYIYGVVSYTGHLTKIMLNSTNSRVKRSRVESITYTQIFIIILVQILLCIFCGVYA